MRHKRFYPIVTLTFVLCLIGGAIADIEINILLLNTEFFFDNEEPYGKVVGESLPVPTAEQYEAKAKAIAGLIDAHQANLVGLVEVENQAVVEKVKSYLESPDDWKIAFDEGRDAYTGQDVAILTKFKIAPGSVTNFPEEREVFFVKDEERDVNPSKILGVELKIADEPFYILIAHLISRRNPANNPKRLAQANVLRRQAVKAMIDEKNVIVMGDMNDTPGTSVVKRLRGFDDIWADLIQTANAVEPDERYTYIHEGQKNLLDHVLIGRID